MAYEEIPIPRRDAKNKRPFKLEITGLEAWPGNRFEVQFDWNGLMNKWIVTFTYLDTGEEFAKGPATILGEYKYDRYVIFTFFDASGVEKEVTPGNLGDEVKFTVFPLQEGGSLPEEP